MSDLAEKLAIGVYGKTGRANAPINQNPDFAAGFNVGRNLAGEPMDAIANEWNRIGSPTVLPASFREWKRGLWAAVVQRAIVRSEEKIEQEHDHEQEKEETR